MATYPIKMLRDEDRQAFVPFTNAAAVVDKDNKSLQELMDNGKYKIQNNVTTASAGKGVLDAYQGKVLNDKFNNYVPLSQKGVANGVASLDSEGKVPSAQLPSYVDDVIESYIVSGSTALSSGWLSKTEGGAALTPEKGKIYLVMTSGSHQNKQYRWGGSTYVLCNPSDVNSVNGMTGVVTLKKLTIQKNGTQVGDTFNGTTDEVINITVPTNNNQLTNGAGYITSAGSITGNAATATKATQDGNGNVIVDTYVKKAGDTMTGDLNTPTLTISSVDKEAHLHFTRNNYNYITAASSGSFAFLSNGKAAGVSANADLIIANNVVQPGTTNVVNLGTSDVKWKNVYATTFQGNATSATKATQDGNGKIIANTYLPLTGGTITGLVTITTDGGLTINGNAADHVLKTRGIVGNDGNGNINGLYLQYQAGYPIYLGNDATYTISADGSTYSGTAASAKKTTGTLTIQKNGTNVQTFNGSGNVTANITVPTKTSELTNDSNYVKNTTYASATTAGVVKLGTGLAMADGVLSVTGAATADSVEWSVVKNKPTAVSYWTNDAGYIKASNTMKGATSTTAGSAGTVPAPAAGKEAQFLRGDGTWAQPSYAASAGSATKATQDASGNTITSTYVKKAGDTMTGDLIISKSSEPKVQVTNGTRTVELLIGSSGTNRGVYDREYKQWIIYMDTSGKTLTPNITGIVNTTDSTSSTTGALQVSGGMGVAKAINGGTTVTAAKALKSTEGIVDLASSAVQMKYNSTDKCLEFIFN